jgi:DNA topoisomerase-1
LREFEHEGTVIKVQSGRFGPYVTDGETNATIPRGTSPTELSLEQALELLARRREAAPSTRGKKKAPARKSATAAKSKATAKAPAKASTATKKAPAKKPTAKKNAAKKPE